MSLPGGGRSCGVHELICARRGKACHNSPSTWTNCCLSVCLQPETGSESSVHTYTIHCTDVKLPLSLWVFAEFGHGGSFSVCPCKLWMPYQVWGHFSQEGSHVFMTYSAWRFCFVSEVRVEATFPDCLPLFEQTCPTNCCWVGFELKGFFSPLWTIFRGCNCLYDGLHMFSISCWGCSGPHKRGEMKRNKSQKSLNRTEK